MAGTPKLYSTNEIQKLIETMKVPASEDEGNELEAVVELPLKVTIVVYKSNENPLSITARFYHDETSDFPSEMYSAEIEDAEDSGRVLGLDELSGLLQIDPNSPLWELEIEPGLQ